MSRHPSPGPSTHLSQPVAPSARQKQKPYTVGIAAGAEDAKYQVKYKDLKRKVKEIEADNDKLHFKVLQAKRSIQRMKLERAILYERLSSVPPSPSIHDRHVYPTPAHPVPGPPPHQPLSRSHSGSHHHREIRDYPPSMESERTPSEYVHAQDNSRVPSGTDGRPSAPPMGPAMVPSHHLSPPRRSSGGQHEASRQLSHIGYLPPVQHLDQSRGHSRSQASPPSHHTHPSPSHHRTRSHSSSHSRAHVSQSYHLGHTHPQQYPENLPPVQHGLQVSPPLSERERPRRHEMHEVPGDHHGHGRPSMIHHSPPMHPSESRSSTSRVHHHQRTGPGTYINRDDHYERHRDVDREREREWDRERERDRDRERSRDLGRGREISSSHILSPQTAHRSRQTNERGDYPEHHASSRIREDQVYYHEAPAPTGYSMVSRSGTPGSGSGSGSGIGAGEVPSRPDSRTQYYDHERTRSYRLRPVNQLNEDIDFVHEDGRSISRDRGGSGGGNFPPPEQSRSSLETRKRSRHDMEIDSENDVAEGPAEGLGYSGGRIPEDRGSKRYHREHHRSVDNQEDGRMGPP